MAGQTLVGAYRLIQPIGEGGMGSVWLAEHVAINRRVAVKLLHPIFSTRDDIVTRFLNEARAASALSDPGIVQIYDFGRLENGQAFIIMELLDGEPLDRRLQRLGTLAVSDALRIVRQVATALGAAHSRGIVHRDLKPENIYLIRDAEVACGERAKLLDFGIAKLGERSGVKTQTHALMGTPLYMSPEQCRGAGLVDTRSDIYSLGCLLFALIAGRPPFVEEGTGDLIIRHVTVPAPHIVAFAPHVQANVDALIARCLEKDPACRFASGSELAAALAGVMSTISNPGVAAIPPQAPTIIASETTLGGAASETSGAIAIGRRRWWIGAVAVAAAATAGMLVHRSREPATAPVAAPPSPDAAIALAPDVLAPDAPDAKVAIRVDSQPAGAEVLVGGELRGMTPLTLEVERNTSIELELVRVGFLAHRETIEPTTDREVVVVLKSRPTPQREDADELMKPVFKRGDRR